MNCGFCEKDFVVVIKSRHNKNKFQILLLTQDHRDSAHCTAQDSCTSKKKNIDFQNYKLPVGAYSCFCHETYRSLDHHT